MFRRTKKKSFLRSIFLILVLWTVPAACASAAESHDRQIIWMDAKEHSTAMFIPELLLNERALEDLPLTDADRTYFRSNLEGAAKGNPERAKEYKKMGRDLPKCAPVRLDERRSDAFGLIDYLKGKDLPDYSKNERIVFVGTIVDVVPGWRLWAGSREVNMVYVRPSSILHGKPLANNRVLAYGELWGSIVVDGIQICSGPPEGLYIAQKGDQILVRAFASPLNSRVLDGASIFPIKEGKALPQPYPTVQDFVPTAVDTLYRAIGGDDEQK